MGAILSCMASEIDMKLINNSRFVEQYIGDKDCLEQLDKFYQDNYGRPRRQDLQIESIECKNGQSYGPYSLYIKLNKKVSGIAMIVINHETVNGYSHPCWRAVKFIKGEGWGLRTYFDDTGQWFAYRVDSDPWSVKAFDVMLVTSEGTSNIFRKKRGYFVVL